ncbi:MAG: GAF domain-containing protein [Anaerolineae bacterium]|nr:GAF domain-containing protein [Anaerolineae bacterium]
MSKRTKVEKRHRLARWPRIPGLSRGSLRTKIIVWSFIPAALILAAVALFAFIAYQQVMEELVIKRDQDVTRLSAGQLAADLSEYAGLLTSVARTADIYRGYPDDQREALNRAGNRLAVFDGGVVILDTFGTVVAVHPERSDLLWQDWSDRACYSKVRHSQTIGSSEPSFSDVVAIGPDGLEVVCVAVPVTGEGGEFVGVMAGMFRLGTTAVSAFYGDIVKLRVGESGSTYLVDSFGRAIYHSDAARIGEDLSAQLVVEQVLAGQADAFRTRDSTGVDIVASYAPVPGTPWSLVVEERWAALANGSLGYRELLLLLLVLGVVVPAVVVAIGVRRITRPIAQLIEAAREVAKGNFGQTITARTGDEVEELAKQFSLMSAQLEESYTHLEQRVADRTKELATLNAIAATVNRSLELDEILNDALDKTLEAMQIEAGGIYLLDHGTGVLSLAAHRGFSAEFVAEVDQLRVGEGFSGRVAQSGAPLIVRDVSADPRLTRAVVREAGLRSLAAAPLTSKGTVLGTLYAVTHGYREFSEQDVELLTSIGHQIGVGIDNARLFAAEQRRAEQFRVISEVGRQITSILDADELLWEIVRLLKETFGYYMITVGLIEGDQVVFRAGTKTGWDAPQFCPPAVTVGGRGITAWVAATGKPLLAPEVSQEPRYLYLPDAGETRSELAVPLVTKTSVIGVLNVESDQPNAFDESDLTVLQSLALQAGIAIENARLYEQAQQLAVMEERSRLARDLHDAVTQTLFSSSLIAEALPSVWETDQEEGRDLLERLRQSSRGALAEMRALLLELRPAALIEASFADLLRQLGEATTGRTGIPVDVETTGACDLPEDVHVTLYRIAQEALNNVVKHSQADHVEVRLSCSSEESGERGSPLKVGLRSRQALAGQGTRVELVVRDNGRGFDPCIVSHGRLGLGIMRERAETIGASLDIESTPGRGTQIAVIWGRDQGQEDPSGP